MSSITTSIPVAIWDKAEKVHIRNQIESDLVSGNFATAIRTVQTEGDALVQEMNAGRNPKTSPYAFQGLLAGELSGKPTEDELYLCALQDLYVALTETFGATL